MIVNAYNLFWLRHVIGSSQFLPIIIECGLNTRTNTANRNSVGKGTTHSILVPSENKDHVPLKTPENLSPMVSPTLIIFQLTSPGYSVWPSLSFGILNPVLDSSPYFLSLRDFSDFIVDTFNNFNHKNKQELCFFRQKGDFSKKSNIYMPISKVRTVESRVQNFRSQGLAERTGSHFGLHE